MNKTIKILISIAVLCTAILTACPEPPVNNQTLSQPSLILTPGDQSLQYVIFRTNPAADSYDIYWIKGKIDNAPELKENAAKISNAKTSGSIINLSPGETYSFLVTAHKKGYDSRDSKIIYATPVDNSTPFLSVPVLYIVPGVHSLSYTWKPANPEPDTYDVYWKQGSFSLANEVKTGTKISNASSGAAINSLAEGGTYSVIVTAHKAGYSSCDSAVKTVTLLDTTVDYSGPGNISIADNKITINWDAVSSADSYRISRAGSRLGTYQILSTVTGNLTYVDENPNPNKYENYYKVEAMSGSTVLSSKLIALEIKIFGPDSYFYDIKYDQISAITTEINNIYNNTSKGHWVNNRFALYFKPGSYQNTSVLQIGFYTSVHGLGAIPPDTKIRGGLECPPLLSSNNVTQNFWRSIENLSMEGGTFRWSVSQAAPARRMKATVTTVFDYSGGWASGGFVSDSYFTAAVGSGSQQQFYLRNCHFNTAVNGINWNRTIQGSSGKVDNEPTTGTIGSKTKINTSPYIREKPFLYFDSVINEYMVFVPALREDAVGTSWSEADNYIGAGDSFVLVRDFYIAKPTDTAATINTALDSGKHIFFTPGRYMLSTPIHVKNPDTVLLGSGFTTLIPASGNTYGAVFIDDVPGVTVASILFDALYNSTYLLCVGEIDSNKDHFSDPTLLADIFLRVGGVQANCNADISAFINSNNVIGDHFWAWRADHGTGVGWTSNKSKNGVVVTGDDVVFYGLFVEHYHEYETLWLGENGRTFFYQNERPYDPPADGTWKNSKRDTIGWAAYKVANHVNKHYAAGMGSYSVFRNAVFSKNAYEAPNKPDVIFKNICTHRIGTAGGHNSVINGAGDGNPPDQLHYVSWYENGNATCSSGPKTGTQPPDEEFNLPVKLHP